MGSTCGGVSTASLSAETPVLGGEWDLGFCAPKGWQGEPWVQSTETDTEVVALFFWTKLFGLDEPLFQD